MDEIQKQIEGIEKEIRETPYHKATEHHIGRLRAKLAKLKDRAIERQGKKRGGGPSGAGFSVRQQGDATVVLVGFPSVGKSTLLNKLTNARSRVAPYEFTTVTVIPGMMEYKGAKIQILDVPGLIEGASQGRGRGWEVLSVVRGADLLIIMAEVGKEDAFEKIDKELYANGVRINKVVPKVVIRKTVKGGLEVRSSVKQDFELTTASDVAREFGYINAEIAIQERLGLDELIDAFAKNRVYVPALFVINKIDLRKSLGANLIHSRGGFEAPPRDEKEEQIWISAQEELGLDKLQEIIWKKLGLVRVYLRRPGGKVDYEEPMIMRQNQTLSEVLRKLGSDFRENKTEVKIWGPGAKYPGQKTSLKTQVEDGMEVIFE